MCLHTIKQSKKQSALNQIFFLLVYLLRHSVVHLFVCCYFRSLSRAHQNLYTFEGIHKVFSVHSYGMHVYMSYVCLCEPMKILHVFCMCQPFPLCVNIFSHELNFLFHFTPVPLPWSLFTHTSHAPQESSHEMIVIMELFPIA